MIEDNGSDKKYGLQHHRNACKFEKNDCLYDKHHCLFVFVLCIPHHAAFHLVLHSTPKYPFGGGGLSLDTRSSYSGYLADAFLCVVDLLFVLSCFSLLFIIISFF